MKKTKNSYKKKAIALAMAATLCAGGTYGIQHMTNDSLSHAVTSSLKTTTVMAAQKKNIITIKRTDSITCTVPKKINKKDWNPYTSAQMFRLYEDKQLTQEVDCIYKYKKNGTYVLSPYDEGTLAIDSYSEIFKNKPGILKKYPFIKNREKSSYKSWGNLDTYYLARYIDNSTGKKLKTPIVTEVHIKGDMNAPKVKFVKDKNGRGGFQWNKVDGATEYMVFQCSNEDGYYTADILAVTNKTKWYTPTYSRNTTFEKGSEVISMNELFHITRYSEDDWIDYYESLSEETTEEKQIKEESKKVKEECDNYYLEQGYEEGKPVLNSTAEHEYFGVIAVSKNGCSVVSNLLQRSQIAKGLVYAKAYNKRYTISDYSIYNSIEELPKTMWVVTCDGKLVEKTLLYDLSNAKYNTIDNMTHYTIPTRVKGTAITKNIWLCNYTSDANQELQNFVKKNHLSID